MRDWSKHWWGYTTHWGQGLAAGVLSIHEPTAAVGILGIGVAYQWAGWVRKGDTVALDIKDIGIGYAVGLACAVLWRFI